MGLALRQDLTVYEQGEAALDEARKGTAADAERWGKRDCWAYQSFLDDRQAFWQAA